VSVSGDKMNDLKLIVTKNYQIWILFIVALLFPRETKSQFANGADIGWLSQMESAGYIFKNSSGVQENCLAILKEKGINALRFRVWVNPTGGWCGKKDVVTMAHRADTMGFKVMLDFHLSDTWADPSHQSKPAAWAKDTFPQLLQHVYDHVFGVLDTLKSIGVIPAWIQIGNETTDGTLWEDGRASTHMNNFAAIINSGYNAAKAVDSTIQVIVHLDNGHKNAMYRTMFDGLKSNGAHWDIIGLSVYPRWANLTWQVDDSLSLINMKDMINRYNTKVMVVEAGYYYYDPTNAYAYLIDLIRKTKSVGGLGVFYWEPECYNWQGYNMGAWDPSTKKPTAAMDAFLDTVVVSVKKETAVPAEYKLNVFPNPFNPSTTIEYALPVSSRTSIMIYDVRGREVVRLIDGFQNAGNHHVIWSADHVPSGVYFCRMESIEFIETKKIILLK
jgi:arabinogalactan endo-1,4-beta-galactosidase